MNTDSAIKKINDEMQKNPNDPYLEAIGHYVIDMCHMEAVQKAIGNGITLQTAMGKVLEKAKKQKRGNVAVLTYDEVFGIVAKCFGVKHDKAPERVPEPKPVAGKIDLDFDSLFD